jgi:hypothetical protein
MISLSRAGNAAQARMYVASKGAGMYRVSERKIGDVGSGSPSPTDSTYAVGRLPPIYDTTVRGFACGASNGSSPNSSEIAL